MASHEQRIVCLEEFEKTAAEKLISLDEWRVGVNARLKKGDEIIAVLDARYDAFELKTAQEYYDLSLKMHQQFEDRVPQHAMRKISNQSKLIGGLITALIFALGTIFKLIL